MSKKKRYYIAYGSNLSAEQMAFRCPESKPVGMGVLKDWKLVFRIHATIEPCEGSEVPVLIWEISEADERNLDRYEGFPKYYRKEDLEIRMTNFRGLNPKKITAMVYIMNDGRAITPPMKGYYDILDKGYVRMGFDKTSLKRALIESLEAERNAVS